MERMRKKDEAKERDKKEGKKKRNVFVWQEELFIHSNVSMKIDIVLLNLQFIDAGILA